ncbi:MAG: NADAR family protein, partial [Gammaproteobacteria bacterium]|nr:NADAR family protein [Gammaproteobacteria bacterium]
MVRIESFRDEFRFLSNFFPSPVWIAGDEHQDNYSTVEHAFQAAKTLDPKERKTVREAASPGEAKKLGRLVKLRPAWDDIKLNVMRDLLWFKFTEHPELRAKLLATEDVE